MTSVHTGSCLCGAVRFTATGPLRGVVYCHCSQCRKQTGHYYAATNVVDAGLSIEGAENITWYSASDFARRGFCATCGSALFWKLNEAGETSVMAGAFDQPSGLKGELHIFVRDRATTMRSTTACRSLKNRRPLSWSPMIERRRGRISIWASPARQNFLPS